MVASLTIRLRYVIVAVWVAVTVASLTLLPSLADVEGDPLGGIVPAEGPAVAAERRSAELFAFPLLSRITVVQRASEGLSAAEQARALDRAAEINLAAVPLLRTIVLALPVTNTGGLFPAARESGTTAITFLFFRPDASLRARWALGQTYAERIEADGDPVSGVTGPITARFEQVEAIERGLPRVEVATVALVALVLALALRALGAPLLVLGTAGIAYLTSTRLVAQAGEVLDVPVPREVEPVMVVLLLGIVTDYALFYLFAVRRRLSAGMERHQAALEATRTTTPIVTAAGLIVALGAAALLVGRLEFFRAFGPGAALTVLVGLAVSITLVPASLAIFGRAVFWPTIATREPKPAHEAHWRTSKLLAMSAAAAGVGVLAFPVSRALDIDLGLTLIRGLGDDSAVSRATTAAGRGFAPGITGPTELLVEGRNLTAHRDSLVRLQRRLAIQPGVAGVLGPAQLPPTAPRDVFVDSRGRAARYVIIFRHEPLSAPAIDSLRRLDDSLPAILAGAGLSGARARLAGDTALAEETVSSIVTDIQRIAGAAIVVNVVLLAVFLRALIPPLYLVATSIASLLAALGLTSLVFEDALGHVDITYYVPFAAAVLLLSLGSDYNLFVVGRIWQQARHLRLRDAVAVAVSRTSTPVGVAAVVLSASFALLALVPLRAFREFAFAMSAGIVLDAFVVRLLLVPSLVLLAGRLNWWPARQAPASTLEPGE